MIDPFTYAVTSLLWTAVGLALVLHPTLAVLPVVLSHPRLVMVPLSPEVTAVPDKPVQPRRRRPWRPTRGNVVAAVLVALAAASVAQNWKSTQSDRRIVSCLRTYANESADALDARTKANAEQQLALDGVVRVVSESFATGPQDGAKEVRLALDKYLEKRRQTLEAQEQNPYPSPPREVCK
jgi:hypothetical protein